LLRKILRSFEILTGYKLQEKQCYKEITRRKENLRDLNNLEETPLNETERRERESSSNGTGNRSTIRSGFIDNIKKLRLFLVVREQEFNPVDFQKKLISQRISKELQF
jgi:hypothetical protein